MSDTASMPTTTDKLVALARYIIQHAPDPPVHDDDDYRDEAAMCGNADDTWNMSSDATYSYLAVKAREALKAAGMTEK